MLSVVTEIQSVEKILTHINEPIEAPVMTPARWPPQAGFDFDQRVDDEGATDQTLILGSLLYWMLKLKVTLGTYWLVSFRCFCWHEGFESTAVPSEAIFLSIPVIICGKLNFLSLPL